MKKLILIPLLIIALNTIANANEAITEKASSTKCLSTLTEDFGSDSRFFSIDTDVLERRNFGKDHLAKAIYIIRYILKEEGCARAAINFGKGPLGRSKSRCRRISVGPQSISCYVESNLGFFFVTHDMQTKANIVFNRWD